MKIILGLLLVLTLTGCGTMERLVTKPEVANRPNMFVPSIMPVEQLPIEWTVITKDNYEKIFTEIERGGGVVTFIALTPEGYQNLSLNTAELRRFIQQQREVIIALRKYYETQDKDQK